MIMWSVGRNHGLKTNALLRVHFGGEEAVDGGGPRREFFTGKYGNSEYDQIKNMFLDFLV